MLEKLNNLIGSSYRNQLNAVFMSSPFHIKYNHLCALSFHTSSCFIKVIYELKYHTFTCFTNDKRPNGSLTFEPLWYTLHYAGTSIYLTMYFKFYFDLILEFIIIFVETVVNVIVLTP